MAKVFDDSKINGGRELKRWKYAKFPEILARHTTIPLEDPNIGLQDQKIDNYLSILVLAF